MDKEIRKQKIAEVKNNASSVVSTGIPLRYRGSTQSMVVHKIPLAYLVYNKHNGRIASLTMSYEKQNGELNAESDADKKIIERFLWDSKKDRNEITLKNLKENTQQRHGIVTSDGVIIDGNRRAMLLNRLHQDGVDHAEYFLAIILPEDARQKDINELEAMYQMGEDDKLDYNPIEKYLKCRQLKESGTSEDRIAKLMAKEVAQIKEWLAVLELMDKYLAQYDYDGIYTRLPADTSFAELKKFLDSYKKGGANISGMDWNPLDTDRSDLQAVCFDYIRADFEVRDLREIAKTGQDGSIFFYEKMWTRFRDNHLFIDEITVDKLRAKYPNEDLNNLLKTRDNDWRSKVKDNFKGNIGENKRRLEDQRSKNEPNILIKRALNALEQVDIDSPGFITEVSIPDMVKSISTIIWKMKKTLEKEEKKKGKK